MHVFLFERTSFSAKFVMTMEGTFMSASSAFGKKMNTCRTLTRTQQNGKLWKNRST